MRKIVILAREWCDVKYNHGGLASFNVLIACIDAKFVQNIPTDVYNEHIIIYYIYITCSL